MSDKESKTTGGREDNNERQRRLMLLECLPVPSSVWQLLKRAAKAFRNCFQIDSNGAAGRKSSEKFVTLQTAPPPPFFLSCTRACKAVCECHFAGLGNTASQLSRIFWEHSKVGNSFCSAISRATHLMKCRLQKFTLCICILFVRRLFIII